MKKILYRDNKNVLRETTVYEVVDFSSVYNSGTSLTPVSTNQNGVIDKTLLPPSQTSGANYMFSTPATTWVVNHNLGYFPLVAVYSMGGTEIEAEVLNISNNQIQINFNVPTAGSVRVS